MSEDWFVPTLIRHRPDKTHALLKGQVEVWTRSYLWTPRDAITFKPALCSTVYGDGRALFRVTTMNLRPAYYVIRCDSRWDCSDPDSPDDVPDFGDFTDEILTELEGEFGDARCGYSGSSRYLRREDRGCDCEECEDPSRAQWPEVDAEGGCSWGRMRWPAGFPTVAHPHPWIWADLLRQDFRP
jgi:hypothetical protein